MDGSPKFDLEGETRWKEVGQVLHTSPHISLTVELRKASQASMTEAQSIPGSFDTCATTTSNS